jgi:hypothetical protein
MEQKWAVCKAMKAFHRLGIQKAIINETMESHSSTGQKEESIYSLNYEAMFRLINKAPDDSKNESSEIDYDNEEESEIVITQEEFNEKINRFFSKLSSYLKSKNISIRDIFRGKIYKVNE